MRVQASSASHFIALAAQHSATYLEQLSKNERSDLEKIAQSILKEGRAPDISRERLKTLHQDLCLLEETSTNVRALSDLFMKVQAAAKKLNIQPSNDPSRRIDAPALFDLIMKQPEFLGEVTAEAFWILDEDLNRMVDVMLEDVTTSEISSLNGQFRYREALDLLDKYKDQLGGAPNYRGRRPTAIDTDDLGRGLFGISMSQIKDWLRNKVASRAFPPSFWSLLARKFGAGEYTRYEYLAQAIQRFGIMIENKDRYLKMMYEDNNGDTKKLVGLETGLFWHGDLNPRSTEEEFMQCIETFFTKQLPKAQAKGDDAVLAFFDAIVGVCFEARARNIQAYVISQSEDLSSVASTHDYDTGNSFENAINAIAIDIQPSDPIDFYQYLENKGLFEESFIEDGERVKASREAFLLWIFDGQLNSYFIDEYSKSSYLEMEHLVFQEKGGGDADAFIAQVKARHKFLMDEYGENPYAMSETDILSFFEGKS